MANNSSARKRVRQNEKHRQSNVTQKSRMRTAVKKVIKATDAGNAKEALDLYGTAQPLIDSLATKGLIHKNKAANLKSKLNKKIKAMV
jgi:small subunit ribosomal protein S20